MGVYVQCTMKMISFILFVISLTGAIAFDCSDFHEDTCGLYSLNQLDQITTTSPAVCQEYCFARAPECQFFTHFQDTCWLLRNCDIIDRCDSCISGPYTPPIYTTCPWPPVPTTTTTTTTTTTPRINCSLFKRETCLLSEQNIITFNHFKTLGQCQDDCIGLPECKYFTWLPVESQGSCWLLKHCDTYEKCDYCVSGPEHPDVDLCIAK